MNQDAMSAADTPVQTSSLSLSAKRELAERLLQKKASAASTTFAQSYSQRAMWFLYQLDPASSAYHVAFATRIRSALDVAALERTIQHMVDRHPMLRTTFAQGDEGPVQRVAGYRQADFVCVPAADWDEQQLRSEVLNAYTQHFDLEQGPVLRATLFWRPPLHDQAADHVLLIVTHHVVMDGWALGLFLNELLAVYAAETGGKSADLVAPAARYTDYVRWQRQLLDGPEGSRLWDFWQHELSNAPLQLPLPTDYPRPQVPAPGGATQVFTIEPAMTARLRSLARSEGVTLYMLTLAVWQLLLADMTGQEDVLIGSPMAGRNEAAYGSIIGHFVNMVVLRSQCQRHLAFREFLGQVRQKVLSALEHQEFPFALLVERLHAGRNSSRSPIFQVSFDFQRSQRFGALAPLFLPDSPITQVNVAGLALEPYFFPQQEGQYELTLQLTEVDEQITGAIRYSTALFAPATIVHVENVFCSILEQIVTNPDLTLHELSAHAETMNVGALLSQLRKLDIKIWVEGERLRVNAPAGCMTPELQKEIGRRKEEIVALLKRAPSISEAALPLKPVPHTGPMPLSFSQQRLWFLDQMNPGSSAYNIAIPVSICGKLNVDALRRSFEELVRRHEMLRTRFVVTNGQAGQVIDSYRSLEMPLVNLMHLSHDQALQEALRLTTIEASVPFDLTRSPLLRGMIVQVAEEEYMLITVCHHIASDGWSIGVILREIGALYPAFAAGAPSPLPPLSIQYADFAVWQRQSEQGERTQRELAYWKRKLADPIPMLDLPADYPRPAVASTRGSRSEFSLDRQLIEELQAFSRKEGVTLYMTLLAAFKTLLYRYTRQTDILVGSPVAGREQSETESLIGFFVNNLVLRTDLSGAPTFRQLLARVRTVTLEAFDHQHVPFDRIVEVLHPQRDLSRSPFFQTLFSLQNMTLDKVELEGLTMERVQVGFDTTRFDLTLELWEQPSGMLIIVEYCVDLFAQATIERMIGHYETLLRSILADANQQIVDLPMLPAREQRQLLQEWNDTQAVYPHSLPVHRLFEAQAADRPNAVAVSFEGDQISYGELNVRANRLAWHLRSLGVGTGALVGIYMDRSIEMILALVAVHKAGGAYLPLDPAFPVDRLAFMLEDSQTRFLVTQAHLEEQMPVHQAQVVSIDRDWPQIEVQPGDNLSDSVDGAPYDPERLAYVLYTSGSTGRPKGVQIPQRALVNFLTSMQKSPGMSSADILLSVTTLSFDIAGLEIFLPLITGAQVEVVSHAVAADGMALLTALQTCGASIMQATPATWRLLLSAGWQGTAGLKILCGGEAMPGDLANQLLPRCASLWNMYGPTETTIWSTVHCVERGEGVMPIGRPIANTQIYVLDEAHQPTPIGVVGELYISGDGVAHGYLNRPELTAEKFVRDPFAGGSARMYRTGDLARYRADGNLDFLGRIDFQVKIRGFRIELGEIEAVLDEHPAIRQAVVVAREDAPGDWRLVAYLHMVDGVAPAASDLRTYLKGTLPDYMAPSVFVIVDSFPLTPNGKVDRKALPAPGESRMETSIHHTAPRTDVERRIAAIWQSVLGVEQVGVTDNFFDLGGHSLLIVQVHSQLRRSFETSLTIAQMFQFPTVEALAAHLERPQAPASHLQQAQDRAARQRAQLERPSPKIK